MIKTRLIALAVLIIGAAIGWFVFSQTATDTAKFPFKLGLDLSGGTHLVYEADTSRVAAEDVPDAMESLRDTIERRINVFGVAEPIVQTEKSGAFATGDEQRLIIELPGVEDTASAIAMIGETPVLEFRMQNETPTLTPDEEGNITVSTDDLYGPAVVTGEHLERATLEFGQSSQGGLSNEPMVVLHFNAEGATLFADMTAANVGKVFGIFLDGQTISTPVIRESIPDGTAVISGNFTPAEAKELVRNLNFGALPLPIELLSSNTIGASLGANTLAKGINAGGIGFIAVMLFMIVWYRVPGLVASIALAFYVAFMLALFQFIPVTLTAAGIAGFILSVGMAVDANVLIFERMKEELKEGKKRTSDAVRDGFARAWTAIRDGNTTSIITAVVLFWFGTSLIKGFALVFGLGVLVSMLSAVTVSRTLMLALGDYTNTKLVRFIFGSGVN